MMSSDQNEKDKPKSSYDFARIEAKWQRKWNEQKLFQASDNPKEKYYVLVMFAYPSGDIHIGHFRNYIIGDAIAHYQMMHGKEILHPFGWDAFGLPAEQAAIKHNLHPQEWTLKNIEVSRTTLQKVGISFDWEREVTSCLPDYYKWTQWLFLKLYEKGLAYRKSSLVNFCDTCNTVLANEQVQADGTCWRCNQQVGKKKLRQWYFKITDYAERLLNALDNMDGWPERVKTLQRNWIGKSVGCEIVFKLENSDIEIPIFTTRPDTVFGVTFMAVAPDAELVEKLQIPADRRDAVDAYIKKALKKSEIERQTDTEEKDGVFTGLYAINPLNGEKVQIWIGDYVLASYGTGVVMAVPAHDQRDFLFAKKYGVPIKVVIKPDGGDEPKLEEMTEAYVEKGEMCNSGQFNGAVGQDALDAVTEYVEKHSIGKAKVNYKLRDWLISRQRYWGTPIPMVHCPECGEVTVPEQDLPVTLPTEGVDYMPKGRSPLADVDDWVNVTCPKCGAAAQRDSDTMDTFVCSSWYMLRYTDPRNSQTIFARDKVHNWLPVDYYIGGIEHATGHLLYFRFMTKFLYDIGIVNFDEPVNQLFNHGMILDDKGVTMSKSLGNAISPIDLMRERGVDISRLAMHFAAPADKEVLWSGKTVTGMERFINKLFKTIQEVACQTERVDTERFYTRDDLSEGSWEIYIKLNQTIKKVDEDLNRMQFNTCIAAIMEFYGTFTLLKPDKNGFGRYCFNKVIKLLAPMAPHFAEEVWEMFGNNESIFKSDWPSFDPNAVTLDSITVAVQVNGKVRGQIEFERDLDEEKIKELALNVANVQRHITGKEIKKVIYVKNRLVSIVVK